MVFKNAISWFEIPTKDLNRAQAFYEEVFQIKMIALDLAQIQMRMFPLESPMGIGGALVNNKDFYKPSTTDGPLVYLNGNPDVQIFLHRIEKVGGKVLVPKTQISPEFGYMAMFIDSEGNRIAMHNVPPNQ